MRIFFGEDLSGHGPGVYVELSGNEVATAITTYLHAHDIYIDGARTVRVEDELPNRATVYVDPSGNLMYKGQRWTGRGEVQG